MARWWWALALVLAGCEELAAGTSHFPDQVGGDGDAGARSEAGIGAADGGMASMVGQWVLFVEGPQCMSAIGTQVENLVWNFYLVDVLEDADAGGTARALRQRLRICRGELSPLVGGLRSTVPDPVADALAARDTSAYLLGSEEGDAYLGSEFVDYWGMDAIGADVPLPTAVDDPRVTDPDGDGEPGVTFVTTNGLGEPVCQVRVVQRTRVRVEGLRTAAGRVAGVAAVRVDQRVLDATSPLCRADTAIVPSPTPGHFVLLRVDGRGGATLDLDLTGMGR
ncbi:MAG: hypothetical protein R3F60_05060 [bacterium]